MKRTLWLLLAVAVALSGCTTKTKRAPGPLRVWLAADDEDEQMEFRMLADDFTGQTKIPVELTFKSAEDLSSAVLRYPDELKGLDVVEVDYFDIPSTADLFADVGPAMKNLDGGSRFFVPAFTAGVVNGTQFFIPWRLTWPAMVATSDMAAIDSFSRLAQQAEGDQVTVVLPGFEDRDLFALLCAVAWASKADPEKNDRMLSAMIVLGKLAKVMPMDSAAIPAGGIAALDPRPAVFFDWPRGILAVGSDIPLGRESVALPCNNSPCVPFSGRYLASPGGAPHPDDAIAFIQFMVSVGAQARLAPNTTWLPVRNDAFGDLGGRADTFRGIVEGSAMLRPLPRSVKVQDALVAAGRKVLFEGATPEQAMQEYQDRMK